MCYRGLGLGKGFNMNMKALNPCYWGLNNGKTIKNSDYKS